MKNNKNNKKICHIFHHNFKNIPFYVMSGVSLKIFYFALFDDGLTLKASKLAFIGIQTLHLLSINDLQATDTNLTKLFVLGGISSSVLSVFFTDKFALSQSDAGFQ